MRLLLLRAYITDDEMFFLYHARVSTELDRLINELSKGFIYVACHDVEMAAHLCKVCRKKETAF
jgi:hypothetical protein